MRFKRKKIPVELSAPLTICRIVCVCLLIYSKFQAAGGAFAAAVAVAEEGFVVFFVGAGEAEDVGSDQEAFGRDVDADFFVAFAESFKMDLACGQVDLDV